MRTIRNSFVKVAPDSPAEYGIVPQMKKGGKPAHLIQYELLTGQPYTYGHEELIFEVYVRHKGIPEEEVRERRQELWDELFSKSHACMRASALPKKYGWGVHYNSEGKMALYAMESPEYQAYLESPEVKPVFAMRSSKGKDK